MSSTIYKVHSKSLDKFCVGHAGKAMVGRLRKPLPNHSEFTCKAKDGQVVCFEE